MGMLENALKKAIKKQVNKLFNPVPQRKQTTQRRETIEEREIREKKEIANRIKNEAQFMSEGSLKIINDCVHLVNTTVNPEVFFMRYNLMLEHLEKLVGLECTGIFENSRELPSEAYDRVYGQFDAATIDFFDRSFENAKNHAETLKTENGKKNAIKRYFDNMEKYIINMDSESMEYFEKMKETHLN